MNLVIHGLAFCLSCKFYLGEIIPWPHKFLKSVFNIENNVHAHMLHFSIVKRVKIRP